MSVTLPFSEACERNKRVILDVLRPYFRDVDSVLELGTGTAQHAIHFARACENLQWQCTDQAHYLDGIRAQLRVAGVKNALTPFELEVNQGVWLKSGQRYPAVYTANTLHIMSPSDMNSFFAGLPKVISDGAYLFVYGPFKYAGEFTSDSNADFDASLRAREGDSAIRDFETVDQLAANIGFRLIADHAMPANNQCLIWQHDQP